MTEEQPTTGAALDAVRPTFLTIEDAAKTLHVSKSTIRKRIRDGILPAKRLRGGHTVLIDLRDLMGLLEDARPALAETDSTEGENNGKTN